MDGQLSDVSERQLIRQRRAEQEKFRSRILHKVYGGQCECRSRFRRTYQSQVGTLHERRRQQGSRETDGWTGRSANTHLQNHLGKARISGPRHLPYREERHDPDRILPACPLCQQRLVDRIKNLYSGRDLTSH